MMAAGSPAGQTAFGEPNALRGRLARGLGERLEGQEDEATGALHSEEDADGCVGARCPDLVDVAPDVTSSLQTVDGHVLHRGQYLGRAVVVQLVDEGGHGSSAAGRGLGSPTQPWPAGSPPSSDFSSAGLKSELTSS